MVAGNGPTRTHMAAPGGAGRHESHVVVRAAGLWPQVVSLSMLLCVQKIIKSKSMTVVTVNLVGWSVT